MQMQVRNKVCSSHSQVFGLELAVDAKTFCNYFHQFFDAGHLGQAFKLIRHKHAIARLRFEVALAQGHVAHFSVQSQNSFALGKGLNAYTLEHQWQVSRKLGLKLTLSHQAQGMGAGIALTHQDDGREVTLSGPPGSASVSGSPSPGYGLSAGFDVASGFSLGLNRQVPSDGSGNLGYALNLDLGADNMGIAPSITYRVSPDIDLHAKCGCTVAGQIEQMVKLVYKISAAQQVQVTFQRNFEEYGDALSSSAVAVDFLYQGFAFKLPIFGYSQSKNSSALGMTCLLFSSANAVALGLLAYHRRTVDKDTSPQHVIYFGRYLQLLDRAETYLRKHALAFNRSLSREADCRGLIIKEAYFGLADHIRMIDAGVDFVLPATAALYEKCQVVPVTKQLQILVQDSQLELTEELFKP